MEVLKQEGIMPLAGSIANGPGPHWAPEDEVREIKPLQAVYAESLIYADFFEKGIPAAFDLPDQPGVVVSALRWQDKLLVRRTDFVGTETPVTISLDGKKITVPVAVGKCQVLGVK